MATESASKPADDQVTPPSTGPVESTVAEPATVESSAGQTAPDASANGAASTAAQPTVVFVTAPQPPKKRGARGIGALVALLAVGLFALVYAMLVGFIALVFRGASLEGVVASLSAPAYWLPVVVFGLSHLLLIVIVNRAGWWAHVLGGFFVAAIVYVSFIGAAIIQQGALGGSAATVNPIVLQQLASPFGFAAAIAAREVPIWVGGLVAKRGRSARARNAAARTAYEQELAEHRATIGASTAV